MTLFGYAEFVFSIIPYYYASSLSSDDNFFGGLCKKTIGCDNEQYNQRRIFMCVPQFKEYFLFSANFYILIELKLSYVERC